MKSYTKQLRIILWWTISVFKIVLFNTILFSFYKMRIYYVKLKSALENVELYLKPPAIWKIGTIVINKFFGNVSIILGKRNAHSN